jgi:hypothetical protein
LAVKEKKKVSQKDTFFNLPKISNFIRILQGGSTYPGQTENITFAS